MRCPELRTLLPRLLNEICIRYIGRRQFSDNSLHTQNCVNSPRARGLRYKIIAGLSERYAEGSVLGVALHSESLPDSFRGFVFPRTYVSKHSLQLKYEIISNLW